MRSEKTVDEIREEIAREKELTALLQESVDHWKGIEQQLEMEYEREELRDIRDIEWKTR
jgi:hypothetical protein